ncbi:unnamed protein product [Zymoseptoria tritici ST99CH_1A5]|uniref:DNA-directed RNA polymerase subunit n=3 Tax=Zymoseptoria tritici TaxID=1047171 RepID=A0A1X7RR62_ZYMT9|nr:unnamed protein product [Zymoseptoria tritici ST99CH_3D7]SMR50716.1 unnamed protein product [Zymoseptoria tritici ST99CH_1E4]SMR51657.1 unnamed protein product [Zymoseptoria tritici ST99CH_3D1]SMY23421.1 unnamed protein product [Zymoseptoria tritici ST99CH_1A5]
MGIPQASASRKESTKIHKKHKSSKSSTTAKPTSTSPFTTLTASLYVSLSPCANAFPLEGLCAEHLSPHLMTYHSSFNGVVLSYSNPRISSSPEDHRPQAKTEKVLARSIDEYAVTFLWLTADFLVFRPERGSLLDGFVNLQSESMLGLLCYNYFNVAIAREGLPEGWNWDGESWNDAEGNPVGEGRKVKCKVEDFVASGGEGLSISATLVDG